MRIHEVHVQTLVNPRRYSRPQLERATRIAFAIQRGKLVLCEPPETRP